MKCETERKTLEHMMTKSVEVEKSKVKPMIKKNR